MGSSQSAQIPSEAEEEEEDDDEIGDEDEEEEDDAVPRDIPDSADHAVVKKILEQEPEMLPCHASASPLSPQLSAYGTPRTGPSIKVWDPYNVLAPPPPAHFHRGFSSPAPSDEDRVITEVYLVSHGECHMNLRPDLIAGRCPDAALTSNGKRQARALAVFLKSQGVRFSAIYASPLDRARATAQAVCQELNLPEEHIQSSDALVEMSQGHWEGCHRSEVFTPSTVSLMEKFQPDFSAPSGESLRQVEFRMVQFLNGTVVAFPDKFRSDFSPPDPSDNPVFGNNSTHALPNLMPERDVPSLAPPNWDSSHKHRQGLHKKKSGKSRLQIVTTGDNEADDEMSPRVVPNNQGPIRDINVRITPPSLVSSCVGVFSHSTPIKCLLTGLLGCSPVMSHKFCIEDSSVTVLQHSWKAGWQIKRMNDTSHLRLL
ncbi:hypothetical protein SASPL_135066 [Salvia splendens]|uniref:Phosphoglycerate mutase n=1 Tax=Salvia splendens TaxID=180675 RepID=A0A8X8ZF36_SALSN|nr:uncharacterized protein LOC121762327 isoform X1 [Salvia splendens]KAG6402852.1 hypothetical protein SASPL_135066 [Salvia splendens]